ATGRHPYQVIPQAEHVLQLGLAGKQLEVRVRLRLDYQRRRLRLEAVIDPDAADFQQGAALDLPQGGPLEPGLAAQGRRLQGEINAELAGLDGAPVVPAEQLASAVVGLLLLLRRSKRLLGFVPGILAVTLQPFEAVVGVTAASAFQFPFTIA